MKALPQGEMRRWFEEYGDLDELNHYLKHARENDWHFDPETGLFLREVLPADVQKTIERTIVDVWFTRPVDLHYHEDVEEILMVLEGRGVYRQEGFNRVYNLGMYDFERMNPIYIPAGTVYTFSPRKGYVLKMRIATNPGVLNPEREIQKVPFYEQWPEGYPD